MIKIICDYRDGVTAVPTNLIDKHLKLASAAGFKVLLFVLRNPSGDFDEETVAAGTGLSVSDVKDCLAFWQQNGVLEVTDGASEEGCKKAAGNAKRADFENAPVKQNVAARPLPVKKPTQRQIAKRMEEEPELSLIYSEAQNILGTFGYDTQALLLMIYDYYGFPPEVIITLLQHQKSEGRASSSAIKLCAEDWAKRGIDTLEAVEKELLAYEKIKSVYVAVKTGVGLENINPTPRMASLIREWAVNWQLSSDMIVLALKECGNSFSEANKLLKKWAQSGITTPEQVRLRKSKSVPEDVKKSYDTQKVGRNSILERAKLYAEEGADKK